MAKAKRGTYRKKQTASKMPDPSQLATTIFSTTSPEDTLTCEPIHLPMSDRLEGGRATMLEEILRHRPGDYLQMLGLVALRCHIHIAAEYVGVTGATIQSWIERGRRETAADLDTFCSRLLKDLRRVIAYARVRAEVEVCHDNPMTYLERGAGKILGNDWSGEGGPVERGILQQDGNLLPLDPDCQSSMPEGESVHVVDALRIPIESMAEAQRILDLAQARPVLDSTIHNQGEPTDLPERDTYNPLAATQLEQPAIDALEPVSEADQPDNADNDREHHQDSRVFDADRPIPKLDIQALDEHYFPPEKRGE